LFRKAEQVKIPTPLPDVRPAAAWQARILAAQGRLAEALDWVRASGVSAVDELSFVREFDHITLARVLIAQHRAGAANGTLDTALRLLARLLDAAEAGERTGSVIEILLLQALAYEARGDIPAAMGPLERALLLAEPQGYTRLFLDEGPPMIALLQAAAQQGVAPAYVSQLWDAAAQDAQDTAVSQPLVDPLSDRELEILTLFAAGLKNKEIAAQLVISLNTVLYHSKNIYSKLGVNKRTLAIARARELRLID
jgi:LuxR family maltose regulon positive regulatory protein